MKALAPALIVMALLTGCNTVVTPSPLFSVADQMGGPAMRTGVWRIEPEGECAADETKPLVGWPDCAKGFVLQDGGVAGYYDKTDSGPVWKTQPLIFAPGKPGVLQAVVNVGGDVKVSGTPYAYAGVRPTKSDDQGRIIALALWPVLCGPPTPGHEDEMTKKLLPGLTAKPDDPVCTTGSSAALRAAAAASEAWAPKKINGHWVRDQDR